MMPIKLILFVVLLLTYLGSWGGDQTTQGKIWGWNQAHADSCGLISNSDLRYYCQKQCGLISNSDLRYYCDGNYGLISNSDLRYYGQKQCGLISSSDLRYLCGSGRPYPGVR